MEEAIILPILDLQQFFIIKPLHVLIQCNFKENHQALNIPQSGKIILLLEFLYHEYIVFDLGKIRL